MSGQPFVRIDAGPAADTSIAHGGGRHLDRAEFDALVVLLGKLNPDLVWDVVGYPLQAHLAVKRC